MKLEQEPKYCIVDAAGNELPDARLANRRTMQPIPDDEPVMVLRAKDAHAVQGIHCYLELCSNPGHQRIARARMDDFREFQNKYPERVKEPD